MLRSRRDDNHVAGAQGILCSFNHHINTAVRKQIDLIIGMAVVPDILQIQITVVIELKIFRKHILAAVKIGPDFFHHKSPFLCNYSIPQVW